MNEESYGVEYFVWHTQDGTIYGVGHIPPGAPSHLKAVPLVPPGSDLQASRITLTGDAPESFDRFVVRQGELVDRRQQDTS